MIPARKYLITGRPGTGKTTLIKKLAQQCIHLKPSGFYSEEIRTGGKRTGFTLCKLDGTRAGILAHRDIKGPYKVGGYGVDVKTFEAFLEEIEKEILASSLVLLDEIGKMECFSQRFCNLIEELLSSDKFLVFTIAKRGSKFIEVVKKTEGVHLVEITEGNRDALISEIKNQIMGVICQAGRENSSRN